MDSLSMTQISWNSEGGPAAKEKAEAEHTIYHELMADYMFISATSIWGTLWA
jgi:hypothetical protein